MPATSEALPNRPSGTPVSTEPAADNVATTDVLGVVTTAADPTLYGGPDDRLAVYYLLDKTGDGWQVTNSFTAATSLPVLTTEMDYRGMASGCGDIFVNKSNQTRSEFDKVSIDALEFALSAEPVTLDLALYPVIIGAWIDVYTDNVEKLGENPYGNDTGPTAVPRSVWQADSGTVTVAAETVPCAGEPYQVDALLKNVVFSLGQESVHRPSQTFEGMIVGWSAG